MAFQLQIYISTCILFVAAALFEYCSIIAVLRFPGIEIEDTEDGQTNERKIMKNKLATARSIDVLFLVLFTVILVVFNIIYFVQ